MHTILILLVSLFLPQLSSKNTTSNNCQPAFGVFLGDTEVTSSTISIGSEETELMIKEKTNCLGEVTGWKFQFVVVPKNGDPTILFAKDPKLDFESLKKIQQLPAKVFIEDLRWDGQRGDQSYSLFFKVVD